MQQKWLNRENEADFLIVMVYEILIKIDRYNFIIYNL